VEIQYATKKHALSRGTLNCLGEVANLNVTHGCVGACVFCYARCFPKTPPPGTLKIYSGLPQNLRRQLDSSRRKSPLPGFVILGSACDAFLGGEKVVHEVTRPCLEILLKRNIGVSLSTRGEIPDDVLQLLGRHSRHVRVFIPLPSLDEDYTRVWEPGTASPNRRLFLIQRLLQVGIQPRVRIEPLIPFINDHSKKMKAVLSAISSLGLKRIIVNFLHIRPGVEKQILREAPEDLKRLVLGGFPYLSTHPNRYHSLPSRQRTSSLDRLKRIARERDIRVVACQCHNSDIPSAPCPIPPPEIPRPRAEQKALFE